MQLFRYSLLALSILGFAGWFWLHKPHSPADDLAPISNTAFQVNAPSPQAGMALAEAARTWRGVTAVTYNPESDLLVVIYTAETDMATLQSGLQTLAGRPITKKDFQSMGGAQCPVPHGVLSALPGIFLAVGAGSLGLFLLMSYRRTRTISPA